MTPHRIQLPRGYDMHVHLRWDNRLKPALEAAIAQFSGVLWMPNTVERHVIANEGAAAEYQGDIALMRTLVAPGRAFQAFGTLYLQETTSAFDIEVARERITAVKAYFRKPSGEAGTTGAQHGIEDLLAPHLHPALAKMQEIDLPLCVHAELITAFVLDREYRFIPVLKELLRRYPRLRVVVEHATDRRMIAFVANKHRDGFRIACTITAHHPLYTLDDVIGNKLRPLLHCMPCVKRPEDMQALREAMFMAEPWCFFGSDSAPHAVDAKICAEGCAGVFSGPVALQTLVELFGSSGHDDWQDRLTRFIYLNAHAFYRLPEVTEHVELVNEPWRVPGAVYGEKTKIIPFRHGETLPWRLDI